MMNMTMIAGLGAVGFLAVLSVATMLGVSPRADSTSQPATFQGHVYDAEGKLIGPLTLPTVTRTEAEWREHLTPEQYRVVRTAGTERAGTGALLHNKDEGVYTCVACGLPLFHSEGKFRSGTGWPSFYDAIAKGNVGEHVDSTLGMRRIEIRCARCEAHLGHVFDDGPRPTGLRYCVNSESLGFTPMAEVKSLVDPHATATSASAPGKSAIASGHATAVFAGGCFWCVEAVFEELAGVVEVISGYAGGSKADANYRAVCSGTTGHAEAVQIIYDPAKIEFAELLEVHFATHDPTQLNRQGNDVGKQYRSAIFFADEQERALAAAMIEAVNDQKTFRRPIVTTLEPLTEFHAAESRHQNYVCNNPTQGYVRGVALPKVDKVRKAFKDKLKDVSPLDAKGGR